MRVAKKQTLKNSRDISDLENWLRNYYRQNPDEVMRVYVISAQSEAEILLQWVANQNKIVSVEGA